MTNAIRCFGLILALSTMTAADSPANEEAWYQIGTARIDITPAYPVRLSGYAVRKQESEGVAQKLWAKAIAIGSNREGPALLITVDNTGVPSHVRDEVTRRLQKKKI